MSRKVANLVYGRRVGSVARKAVLSNFADKSDDFGRGVFASKQTIADETELGRSTVIRIVNEFVSEGILVVSGSRPCRNGSTIVYDIDLSAVSALPEIGARDQSQSGTSQPADQSQSGTPPVPGRDPMGSQSGTQTVHEPSLNLEEEVSSAVIPHPEPNLSQALAIYSEAAGRRGWSKVEKFTPARKSALRARLKDAGGLDGWAEQVARAERSDFLCGLIPGRDGRVFKCSLDFLNQQQSFVRLMEGIYDNRDQPTRQDQRAAASADAMRDRLDVVGRMRRTSEPDWLRG